MIHPAFAIGRMVVRCHRRGLAAMTAWMILMAVATAIAPAVAVAERCASLKLAGTVTTARSIGRASRVTAMLRT